MMRDMNSGPWFAADTHFGHANICKYSNRPFASIEKHDEALIDRWNAVVPRGGLVYHLGDFMMTWKKHEVDKVNKILARLNGTIHLICGNHDRDAVKSANFAWIGDYKSIQVDGQKIVLFHYPIRSWHGVHRSSWHLHGHSHGNLADNGGGKILDVGVDCWDYKPVSFEQVKEVLDKKPVVSVDHH